MNSITWLTLVFNTYLPFGQVSDATNETPRNKRGSMIPNRFKGPSILVELLFWIEMSNSCILTQVWWETTKYFAISLPEGLLKDSQV